VRGCTNRSRRDVSRAAGCVIYNGFFELLPESRPASDCEVLIREGLFAWHEAQQQSPFT